MARGGAASQQAQAMARNVDAALAAAQRCIELAPNDADCLYIMGKASMELGQVELAVQYMEQALDLSPLPPASRTGPKCPARQCDMDLILDMLRRGRSVA